MPGSSGQRLRRARVRSVRAECLDGTLARGHRHLKRALRIYISHYNRGRPHRGLDLDTPDAAHPYVSAPYQ
ncbi:MAG TPA: integrase core domain-containing protein [Actinomycetota bacterium]